MQKLKTLKPLDYKRKLDVKRKHILAQFVVWCLNPHAICTGLRRDNLLQWALAEEYIYQEPIKSTTSNVIVEGCGVFFPLSYDEGDKAFETTNCVIRIIWLAWILIAAIQRPSQGQERGQCPHRGGTGSQKGQSLEKRWTKTKGQNRDVGLLGYGNVPSGHQQKHSRLNGMGDYKGNAFPG